MKIVHQAPQRRLRYLLACAGASGGAVWGTLALALARDPRSIEVLGAGGSLSGLGVEDGEPASAASTVYVLALLAAPPLGALVGARPMDLLSHAAGRRPALLASAALVLLGVLIAIPGAGWAHVWAAATAGLGLGGYAIVLPKVAHELAQRGHKRLMPRLSALGAAGAGCAVVAGELGWLLNPSESLVCAWLVPLVLSLAVIMLMMTLPETPHWYAARGNIEAAYQALRRMSDAQEAAISIDWVVMDAGMLGEQHPLCAGDLRVARLRRTIAVGFVLEAIQILPLGLTAICLVPTLLNGVGGGRAPLWALACLALLWGSEALLSLRRRPERLLLAWALGGVGLATCGLMLLTLAPGLGEGGRQVLLVAVAAILAAAQYVCVAPACVGGADPLIPPWLLRSQRRAEAAGRPLVQLVSLLGPVSLMVMGVSGPVLLGVCLGMQVAGLLLILIALPRLSAALR